MDDQNTKECIGCKELIEKKAKVCPYCKKRQPNKIETVIVIVLIVIGLVWSFIQVKEIIDGLDMKMVNLDNGKGAVTMIWEG